MGEGNKNLYDESFMVSPTSEALFKEYFDSSFIDYYFKEIRRRQSVLLMQNGEDCKLLIRRIEGTKCLHYDDYNKQCKYPRGKTKAEKDSGTNVCFNTGFVGGYYTAVDIKVRFVPSGEAVVVREGGRRVEYTPRSWTVWLPVVKDHDIVVTSRNERFRLGEVTRTGRWRGQFIRQEFNTYMLPMTDPIYDIDIDFTYR